MTELGGELQRRGARRLSRRAFLKGAAGVAGVGVLVAAGGLGIPRLLDALGNIDSGVDGKFLRRQEDGMLVISDTPQVVKAQYTPHADPTSNKDNIIVYRRPVADAGESKYILPEDIKTQYAIRVAGGAYETEAKAARFEVSYKGQTYTIGEWFVPSDQQGNPVNPKGEPLQKGEKPYFITTSFVTIIPDQAPAQ